MHKALHPYENIKITVSDHIREFGNDEILLNERARCPLCKERMSNRAPSTPNSSGHFSHLPNRGYCPTKEASGLPYLGKHPRRPDPEAARRMKAVFVQNWQKHFIKLDQLVKGLHIDEFKKVVVLADQEHIWEYSELEEYQLPYIFSTLMDYPATSSFNFKGVYKRKYWIRCWFESSISRYDDLWIHRTGPLYLTKAWYTQPTKGKPKLDDLIDFYPQEVTSDFLSSTQQSTQYIIKVVDPWIRDRYRDA